MNCIKIIDTLTGSAVGSYFDDDAQDRAEQSLVALNEYALSELGHQARYKIEVDLRTVQPKSKPVQYISLVSYTVHFEVPQHADDTRYQAAFDYVEQHLPYIKATVHNIAAEAGRIAQHIVTVRVGE